jgi:hypothetical protein
MRAQPEPVNQLCAAHAELQGDLHKLCFEPFELKNNSSFFINMFRNIIASLIVLAPIVPCAQLGQFR